MNKIKRFVKYFKGGFKVLENISEILKYFKLKYYTVHFYPYTLCGRELVTPSCTQLLLVPVG